MRTILRLVCVIVLGSLLSCGPSASATTEANKDVVRRLIAAINARDFDQIEELVAPDVVRHSQATAGVEVRSREQFKEFLRQDLTTFPDAQQEIHTLIAEGDKVALYLTLTGTQEGPAGPFPATGKKVEVRFLGIMRVENGKVAEIWVEWDNLSILTQLGHFPPAQPSPGG
jgi:steroid delta-isomerase-like uncharacterized protein